MTKIWITNESSSFARSFDVWCKESNKYNFVNSLSNTEYDYYRTNNRFMGKEIDLFDQALKAIIERSGAEVIIHQLPISPDKSSLSPGLTLERNVLGTQCLIDAAKALDIPIVFITTRNYDVKGHCKNIYDTTALTVESLLDVSGVAHMSIVPPIIYGPLYDEELSGLLKSSLNKKEDVVINTNINTIKSFMHIKDFINCLSKCIETNIESDGVTIKEETKIILSKNNSNFCDIIDMLYDKGLSINYKINDIDETLFLRNLAHAVDYNEEFDLESGIDNVLEEMRNDS